MDRAENNAIQSITFMQAFPRLLEQAHRPEDPELMRKTVQMLASLNNRVKFYHFDVNNFKDVTFAVSYQALTGHYLKQNNTVQNPGSKLNRDLMYAKQPKQTHRDPGSLCEGTEGLCSIGKRCVILGYIG